MKSRRFVLFIASILLFSNLGIAEASTCKGIKVKGDSGHALLLDYDHILFYYAAAWSGAFVRLLNINNCTFESDAYDVGYTRKMFRRNEDSVILVSLDLSANIRELDVHTGAYRNLFRVGQCVDAMILDDRHLALTYLDESVEIWNYTSRKRINTFQMEKYGHERAQHGNDIIQYTPNWNGTLLIWDTKTGNCTNTIPIPKRPIKDSWIVGMLSLDREHVVLGYSDGFMEIWQLSKPRKIFEIQAHRDFVRALTKIDETRFASGGNDKLIKIWDWKSGKMLWQHETQNSGFELTLLEGSRLAVAYQDASVEFVGF